MRNFFRLFVFAVVLAATANIMSAQLGRKKADPAPAAEAAKPAETAAAEAPAAETTESSPLTEEKLSEVIAAALANHQERMSHASPQSVVESDIFKKVVAYEIREAIAASTNHTWWMSVGALVLGVLALLIAFLKQPKEKKGVNPGTVTMLALAFAFSFTANAAPTCYNAETGKTSGSVKAAIAVVNADNTFVCSVSGKKVELVEPEDTAKVVVEGKVTKESPLEFKFKPAIEGRLVVKVDGKLLNQVAIRDEKTAVAINDALDLAGSTVVTSGGDEKLFRSFLLGMAQHYGIDPKEILALLNSSRPGTSKQAVARIEDARKGAIVDATFRDDRYVRFTTAAGELAGALEGLKNSLGDVASKEDLDRVERKADGAYDKAEAAVRTADEAKSAADHFKQQLIEANKAATAAMAKATRVYDATAKSGNRGEKKALAEPKPQATAVAKPNSAAHAKRGAPAKCPPGQWCKFGSNGQVETAASQPPPVQMRPSN